MEDHKEKQLEVYEKIFDNMVQYWHTHDTEKSLIEFLGLTMEEYNKIV